VCDCMQHVSVCACALIVCSTCVIVCSTWVCVCMRIDCMQYVVQSLAPKQHSATHPHLAHRLLKHLHCPYNLRGGFSLFLPPLKVSAPSLFLASSRGRTTQHCFSPSLIPKEVHQGWPGPYICTIYDRIFGGLPAKHTVYAPFMTVHWWFPCQIYRTCTVYKW